MRKDKIKNIELEDLGADDHIKSKIKELNIDEEQEIARVASEHKELYQVKNSSGEYKAQITGKQRYEAQNRSDYPAVGDWVVIKIIDDDKALIKKILPRKTILQKKYSNKNDSQIIATNIDAAFIVESLDRDYNLNRFERYIILVKNGKITPVIVLNKIDLIGENQLFQVIKQIKNRFENIEIILTNTIDKNGIDDLTSFIQKGKTYCFLGSSGVGKSSLINKLLKQDAIRTNKISSSSKRGKHTTTARQMYILKNGGIVIDNPGTREVGIININDGIKNTYDEIATLANKCKFADCTHLHEPGCAVLAALDNHEINKAKYQNYIRLKKENDFNKMDKLQRRQKDRKFGKFIKHTKKQLEKINN